MNDFCFFFLNDKMHLLSYLVQNDSLLFTRKHVPFITTLVQLRCRHLFATERRYYCRFLTSSICEQEKHTIFDGYSIFVHKIDQIHMNLRSN